ncbi:MAG TPA: hypothetical protein VHJ78_13785 [Actinomycetota bacterium]|nr:hypothetical protein [Actinomycetota bacterium]
MNERDADRRAGMAVIKRRPRRDEGGEPGCQEGASLKPEGCPRSTPANFNGE